MTEESAGADAASESQETGPEASDEAMRSEQPSARQDVGWPVEWSGVVETIAATRGLDGSWNVAALGLSATDRGGEDQERTSTLVGEATGDRAVGDDDGAETAVGDGERVDGRVRAYTWGRTETRRNLVSRGGGVIQFTRDPVDFVEAACSVREEDDPVLASADAWVRVEAERVDTERIGSPTEGEVERVEWALEPVETHVERAVVPTTDRAHAAVVEATVAASRLDVPEYDTQALRDRIRYFGGVVESCGGERHHEAWERFEDLVDWR